MANTIGRMTVCIPEIKTSYAEKVKIDDEIISENYSLTHSKDYITYQIPSLLSCKTYIE